MNIIKKDYIILMILITIFIVYILLSYKNNQLKKRQDEKINNQRDIIENCIDIENKSKRSIYENIKLSEYCIDKFGTIE
tara:strand:+ start:708 stop:944 length:237 start_codon:yes stop_codon:yes gene_type:complete